MSVLLYPRNAPPVTGDIASLVVFLATLGVLLGAFGWFTLHVIARSRRVHGTADSSGNDLVIDKNAQKLESNRVKSGKPCKAGPRCNR